MASRPGVLTTVWYCRAVSTGSPRMPLPTSVPETPHRYSSAASKHGQSRWVQVGLAGSAAGQCRQQARSPSLPLLGCLVRGPGAVRILYSESKWLLESQKWRASGHC